MDLIELLLNLRHANELDVELFPNLSELILDHRQHVGALHLGTGRSDWPRRSSFSRFPHRATAALLASCSG